MNIMQLVKMYTNYKMMYGYNATSQMYTNYTTMYEYNATSQNVYKLQNDVWI